MPTLAEALGQGGIAPPPMPPPAAPAGMIAGIPGAEQATPTRMMGAGTGDIVSLANSVPEPPKITGKTLSSLEDLVNAYPGLSQNGSGWLIKVNRVAPKQRNGVMVAGDQGNHPRFEDGVDLCSIEGFRQYFGGGKYEITVYGPHEADPSVLRRHNAIDLIVPDMTQPNAAVSPGMPNMSPAFAGVAAERVKGENDISRMLVQNLLEKPNQAPQNTGAEANIAVAAMGTTQQMAQMQLQALQSQLQAAEQRAQQFQQLVMDLQSKQSQSPQDRMMESMWGVRSAQQDMDRLRSEYDERIRRIVDDYESRLQRMAAEQKASEDRNRLYNQQLLDGERSRASAELASAREEVRRERERADTIFNERLRMEQDRFMQQLNSANAEHVRQIDALRADALRNETAMRRDHERDLAARDNTHAVALRVMQSELDRSRADCAEAKQNLKIAEERIQREVNKPFAVAMAENIKFAEMMGFSKDQGGTGPDTADKIIGFAQKTLGTMAPIFGPAVAQYLARSAGGGGAAAAPTMTPNNGLAPPPQLQPSPQQQPQQQEQRRRRPPPFATEAVISTDPHDMPLRPIVESGNVAPFVAPDVAPPPSPPAEIPSPPPAGAQVSPVAPPPSPPPAALPPGLTPAQAQIVQRLRGEIRTKGAPPVPAEHIDAMITDVANGLTAAYYGEGGPAPAQVVAGQLKAGLDANSPGMREKLLAWVDADNAAKILQMATVRAMPRVNWGLDAPRQWLAEVWAALALARENNASPPCEKALSPTPFSPASCSAGTRKAW